MNYAQRTHTCGELRKEHLSCKITLNGWVHKIRDLGGLFFIDLRDRTGITQVILDPKTIDHLDSIKPESCLSITGMIKERSDENKNQKMPTGEIELTGESFQLLSRASALPFQLADEEQMHHVNEELRVKYRYLDLRRSSMYKRLALRAAAVQKIRKFLDQHHFLEVETPIFTRSTPEGARDYLVPYRLEPGKFYALPQSPQQYKQLLMVAGIDRYYQIAKCFRDEAQRSDRQPEFTQLDLEMSFVKQEDILKLTEAMTLEVFNELISEFNLLKDPLEPFTRLTYADAIEEYGCDKPDLRFGLKLFDISSCVKTCDFEVFRQCVYEGGRVRGVRYPMGTKLSRKDVQTLEAYCKDFGAKGMAYMYVESGTSESGFSSSEGLFTRSPIVKFFKNEELESILKASCAEAGDLLCFIADRYEAGNNVLYRLRNKIGEECGLRNPRKLKFCWVVDFPLVEWDEQAKRWNSTHHPFTSPKEEDLVYFETDPSKIRANCYDIVCNGIEWASGSTRIHDHRIQKKVFDLLGIDEETQKDRFGHILEAFQYGPPPHGGIAPGIDRMVMFLTDDENIREVIAFPKIGNGHDPMMDSPSHIDAEQWSEIGLKVTE